MSHAKKKKAQEMKRRVDDEYSSGTRFKYEMSHTTKRPPSSVMLHKSAFLSSFKRAAITGNEKIQIIAKLVTTLVIRKY